MVTERISARTWPPVLWLDVVSLGARIVVVVHPRAGEVRVKWGNLRHLDLTSFPTFTTFTVSVGCTFRRREISRSDVLAPLQFNPKRWPVIDIIRLFDDEQDARTSRPLGGKRSGGFSGGRVSAC